MTRTGLACVLAISLTRAAFADEPEPPPEPAVEPVAPPAAEPPVEPAPAAVIPDPDRAITGPSTRSRDLVIEVPGERTRQNKLIAGGLLATGVVASALGVYWHLDSRDASNAVSTDAFTGRAWTSEQIALVDRADRSKSRATIAYAVGGAFLVGGVVTWILTEPKSETAVIRTGVVVTPTAHGGTVVGKLWSF